MRPLRGLYAITPDALCSDASALASASEAALRGGARLLQLRDKRSDASSRRTNAERLLALCRRFGAAFIVNDDLELAAAIGADGVHVGASDAPVALARARLGAAAIVGTSCANVLARAVAAQEAGASYVAFGRFFASNTKPNAPQAELPLLREASRQVRLPVCAIGGVTPAHVPQLIEAGASLVAAVEGVFGSGRPADIEAAARSYSRHFDQ